MAQEQSRKPQHDTGGIWTPAFVVGLIVWIFTSSRSLLWALLAFAAMAGLMWAGKREQAREAARWYADPAPSAAPPPASQPLASRPVLDPPSDLDGGPMLMFSYIDAQGEESFRTVTPLSIAADRLQAWCHDRQDERTFLLRRIKGDVIVADTGELLDPFALRRGLAGRI